MKKIIAKVLALVIVLGLLPAFPAAYADSILTGAYTFIDSAYSPELGVYVIVAKDFNKSTVPTDIYFSTNAEEWTKTKSFSNGIHYANKMTRQNVVWWQGQHCFALFVGSTLYTSTDGKTWKEVTNSNYNGSNSAIETNGDHLAIANAAKVKILKNLTDDPVSYVIGETNTYGKALGLTDTEPYNYSVTDQWKTWEMNYEGTIQSATPNIAAHPFEMAYAKGMNGWLVVNGTAVLRLLSDTEVRYTPLNTMKLSDGTVNASNFSAAAANDDNVIVGTSDGKIYVAPNDKSSLTVEVLWEIAEPGMGDEITEEIRSISPIEDGKFLALSEKGIYIVAEKNGKWNYYDVSASKIVLENTRIEIPLSENKDVVLNPVNYNYMGEISTDKITSISPESIMPLGMYSEGLSNDRELLTVTPAVTGGHELKYRVSTQKGKSQVFTITIVDEDGVDVEGVDSIAIPLEGDPDEIYAYTPFVVGTDGEKMERPAKMEVISMPDGAVFDEENNTFKISADTESGEIVFKVCSEDDEENSIQKTVPVSARRPDRIEFTEQTASAYVPDSGSADFSFAAVIYDQTQRKMPDEKIVYEIRDKEGNAPDGITIDKNTGKLTVKDSAGEGTVTVKALSETDASVYAETEIELLFTDLRKTKEDLKAIVLDISPVTESFMKKLPQTGELFQSTVTWDTSDKSLLYLPDGVNLTAILPQREEKSATLTATAAIEYKDADNNTVRSSSKRSFDIVLKKSGNILDSTYAYMGDKYYQNVWYRISDNEPAVSEIDGEMTAYASDKGIYKEYEPEYTKATFAFFAKVKGDKDKKITVTSEMGGNIAETTATGGYEDISGIFFVDRRTNETTDTLKIETNGELYAKDMILKDVTLELDALSASVNKAVYSKKQADIDSARTLLNEFYDLPIKDELAQKLDSIVVSQGSGNGGGGGGGSSSGSSKNNRAPSAVVTSSGNNITLPIKEEDDLADQLDTYLLKFKDMKDHWARDDVEFMGSLDIVKGSDNGDFLPENTVTRAEFAALIVRTVGETEAEYENSFFDVIKDDWYSGYVQAARNGGYMMGYDGLFNPTAPITREEIAKVIVSAYNRKAGKKLEIGKSVYFNDIDEISSWAYDYVAEAVELGIINGVSEGFFAAKQKATRAQAAVMLKRMYDKLNPSE